MKFAFCNEILQEGDLKTAYQFAHSLGYRGLEVAPFTLGEQPTRLTSNERRQFRQVAHDAGLEVIGLHWLLAKTEGFHLTTTDKTVRQRTADYLRELIELCRDLDGRIMVLGSPQQRNFPPDQSHAQAAGRATEVLAGLTDDLAAAGVTLAVEPLGPAEGNFLNTAADGVALINAIGHPNVRLHLDVKAMSSESKPVGEIIRDCREYVAHFHANDPNRLGPGMGDFDQRPAFHALREIGYDGWVSVEVFEFELGYESILRRSMEGMKSASVISDN